MVAKNLRVSGNQSDTGVKFNYTVWKSNQPLNLTNSRIMVGCVMNDA